MYRDDARDEKTRNLERRLRMGRLHVLIADGDRRTADLVKRALFVFGFKRIDIVVDGKQALQALSAREYHLLITETKLKTIRGRTLIQKIRNGKNAQHLKRDMPIIMLTAQAEKADIESARDAGINEFVCKPFNANSLAERIIMVIDSPRVFVDSLSFSGPCRRRKQPVPPGQERRKPPPIVRKRAISGNMLPIFDEDDMLPPLPKPAILMEANMQMKELIGTDISAAEIITPEVVQEAQESIDDMQNEFVVWARDDIAKLEACFAALSADHNDNKAHYNMLSAAYAIQSQAGIFGYDLGTQVAGMLVDYLNKHTEINDNNLLVIRKHIDTINAIFTQKLKDAGEEIGKEFILSLMGLIEKFG
jgi:CheY-like chemotaxis protein